MRVACSNEFDTCAASHGLNTRQDFIAQGNLRLKAKGSEVIVFEPAISQISPFTRRNFRAERHRFSTASRSRTNTVFPFVRTASVSCRRNGSYPKGANPHSFINAVSASSGTP
jgi:preprotein translocase subunit SecB